MYIPLRLGLSPVPNYWEVGMVLEQDVVHLGPYDDGVPVNAMTTGYVNDPCLLCTPMLWAHLNRHSTRCTRSFTQTFPFHRYKFSTTPFRLQQQQLPLTPAEVQAATRAKYGESFTEKIGKPGIRNQVLVSKLIYIVFTIFIVSRKFTPLL
jgi:hypothetical protein